MQPPAMPTGRCHFSRFLHMVINIKHALIITVIVSQMVASTSDAANRADEHLMPIEQRTAIRFCVDPQWMPFERLTHDNKYEGIVADFVGQFAQQLPIPMVLIPTQTWDETLQQAQAGACDLIPAMNTSEERRKHFGFTTPYLESAVVIITRQDSGYLDGFESLAGKHIGIVSGYIYDELLKRDHPEIKRIYTPSVAEAFRQVASGKLDATITSLLAATQLIQQQGLTNLKIAGDTGFSHQLRVAVRKDDPVLLQKFQQLVDDIPETTRNQILQRWYTVKLQQAPDHSLLYQLAALTSLLLGLLYYRSHRIRRESNQLGQLNSRLHDRNVRLERINQTDTLTGALTRQTLCGLLQQSFKACQQQQHPFSLILIEICGFRELNRQQGHTVADLILSETCHIIQEWLPPHAEIGRWNGDQFLIMLCETSSHQESQIHRFLLPLKRHLEQHQFYNQVQIKINARALTAQPKEALTDLLYRLEQPE